MSSTDATRCWLCDGPTLLTVARAGIPAVQNRVYSTAAAARSAKQGRLEIRACTSCGYAFNAAFDPALVEYDPQYDNDVPSPTFDEYYRQIAAYLRKKYLPRGGTVLDIGCGKGKFLRVMTELFADVRGVGIDPACSAYEGERLKLIAGTFPQCRPAMTPDLVICRHTLEHIPYPAQFIRAISRELPAGTPVFVEVPTAQWIVDNRAFWDWCYEHVNYFVPHSATSALTRGGVRHVSVSPAFGGQYMWLEGRAERDASASCPGNVTFAQSLAEYAAGERDYVQAIQTRLANWKDERKSVAVWGMATKGIEFVSLVDHEHRLIDCCVDINRSKQNQYTPVEARKILSPSALRAAPSPLVVIAMNPRYLAEIQAECQRMQVDAQCISL